MSARLAQTERLIREYGPGFSRANLHDMRGFHDMFEIRYPPAGKSSSALIPQPLPVEKTTIQSLRAAPVRSICIFKSAFYHIFKPALTATFEFLKICVLLRPASTPPNIFLKIACG